MTTDLVVARAPGIYRDLPIEQYHGDISSISKTGLDAMARAPAIYHAQYLDPDRPPEPKRAGQLEGSLAHCALLEPDEFDKRYAVKNFDGRTSAGKAEAAQIAEAGMTPINIDQRAAALAQATSMRKIPAVRLALDGDFETEMSAYAADQKTGVMRRCRPDLVHRAKSGAILFDVKTFSSANADDFARQVARKRYFVQHPFYCDVFEQAADVAVLAFVFIVVETEYPYLSAAMMLDDDSAEYGRRAARRDLDRYAECRASGVWPGYGADATVISLPRWLTQKDEDE